MITSPTSVQLVATSNVVATYELLDSSTEGIYYQFAAPEVSTSGDYIETGIADTTSNNYNFRLSNSNTYTLFYSNTSNETGSYSNGQIFSMYVDSVNVYYYLDGVVLNAAVSIVSGQYRSYIEASSISTTYNISNIRYYPTGKIGPVGPAGTTGPTGPSGGGGSGGSGGSGASGATGGVDPDLQTVTVSSGSATFDWSLGSNGFIRSGGESNYTLDLSNFPTASNSAYDLTILYEQNTPGAYAEQMNIGGNTVTRFCFSNDITPSTVAYNWEIQKFKIFYFSSSNVVVLSVLETYCSNSNAPPPE